MFLPTDYRAWEGEDGQHAKGHFILLFQRKWEPGKEAMPCELRVLVRAVQLNQLGGFMMGRVKIKCPGWEDAIALSLSGAFGNDNLPMTCPDRLWEHLHPVPQEVADRFWTATGGNEPGAGSAAIFEWAKSQADSLQRLRKHDQTSGPTE